jgi:hypothetical protein
MGHTKSYSFLADWKEGEFLIWLITLKMRGLTALAFHIQ